MRLAFVLYKYFPFGGLARDFKRIADECLNLEYEIDVFVMEWHGALEPNYQVNVIKSCGLTNHGKVKNFHELVKTAVNKGDYAAVIGFNRMPELDVYYAADPCYVDRFRNASWLEKLNPRYKFYASMEASVFGKEQGTLCLMISDVQKHLFEKNYHTPQERLLMLPPGIDVSRRRPDNAESIRASFRVELGFKDEDLVVLMVGTGFKTKGVDRAISALSNIQGNVKNKTHLVVVGEDDIARYKQLAVQHKVGNTTHFMGGRSDVPKFLLSADLLLHPARKDNTGTVILEALVAGLPVLVTDVCGYAKHVTAAGAGITLTAPFKQEELNENLAQMLLSEERVSWVNNALKYAASEDLYSMPLKAAKAIDRVAKEKKSAV